MFKRNLKILSWFNFFSEFKLYSPIAIIYFVAVSNSMTLGMSIFSIVMVTSSLFELPTGIFSDMIGRRKTIIAGSVCSLMAVILYAVYPHYIFLVIGAIFEGVAKALFSGNNDAFLYDNLAASKDSASFDAHLGKLRSMFNLSLVVVGFLGSLIASVSMRYVMLLSIIPQIICLALSVQLKEMATVNVPDNHFKHLKNSLLKFFSNSRLRNIGFINMLNYALSESAFQFRSIFINQLWPLWSVGLVSMMSNLGATVGFWFSGKILKRLNSARTILVCGLYSRAANLTALLLSNVTSPLIMVSTSLFYGPSQIAIDTIMQKEYSDEHRATMGSISSFFGSLVFAVISLLVGVAGDHLGSTNALMIVQVLLFPVTIAGWFVISRGTGKR